MISPMQPALQGRTRQMSAELYRQLSAKVTGLPAPNVTFVEVGGKISQDWFDVLKTVITDLPSDQSRVVSPLTGRLEPDWFRAFNTYLET